MDFYGQRKAHRRLSSKREVSFARQMVRGIARIAVLSLVLGAIWHLTRFPLLSISNISIEGGETVSHEAVREKARSVLEGSYLLLIPRTFVYLYPHDELVRAIDALPRVKEVSLTREDRTLLSVAFTEYMPHALWCTTSEGKCWFMDDDGYAFTEAPPLQGGVLVRHYGAHDGEIGEGQVLDPAMLAGINTFMERSNSLGFRTASVFHHLTGDVEFTFHGGGAVLTNGKDFTLAIENMRAIVLSPEFKHLRPGNFGYIDVRFDGKAFVNESIAPQATTTATTTLLSE